MGPDSTFSRPERKIRRMPGDPLRIIHLIGPDAQAWRLRFLRRLVSTDDFGARQSVVCYGRFEGRREYPGPMMHLPAGPFGGRFAVRTAERRIGSVRGAVLHVWSLAALEWCIRLRNRTRAAGRGPAGVVVEADTAGSAERLARLVADEGGLLFVAPRCRAVEALVRAGVPRRLCTVIPDAADELRTGRSEGRFRFSPLESRSLADDPRREVRRRMRLSATDEAVLLVPPFSRRSGVFHATWGVMLAHKVRPHIRILLPHRGPQVERLLRLADSAGHRAVFRATGYRLTLDELLAAADVAVCATASGGSVADVVGCLAAGVPVVANDPDGVREVLSDTTAVRLCRPGDPRDAARRVLELLDGRDRASQRARAAREALGSERSIVAVIRRYRELYQSVLESRAAMLPDLRKTNAALASQVATRTAASAAQEHKVKAATSGFGGSTA
jgi:hypothetical protein